MSNWTRMEHMSDCTTLFSPLGHLLGPDPASGGPGSIGDFEKVDYLEFYVLLIFSGRLIIENLSGSRGIVEEC